MTDQEYECPVDGCTYRNAHGSVIAHAVGKKDEAHAGLAYQEVRKSLDAAGPVDGTDEETSREPEGKTVDMNTSGGENSSGVSVFDEPSPERQPNSKDVDVSEDSWPLVPEQKITGADGNTYRVEAGDRVTADGSDPDAIPLTAGQTVKTTDGNHIETEQGDYLA